MSGDTVRPPYIANKIFPMATSEIGRHVESCQYQYYISTGHRLMFNHHETCHIWSLDQAERMCLTAFSNTGSKPVLSNSLTYHSQTCYIDSWHHSGDSQTIWWPLTSGGRQTTMTLFTIPPTYSINCNSYWIRCFMNHLKNGCLIILCLC